MTWVRGIAVCGDSIAAKVAKQLAAQSRVCRLVSAGGETALAFAARDIPGFQGMGDDSGRVCVAGSWDRQSEFTWRPGDYDFPKALVPKLLLTVGLSIGDAQVVERSPFLRSLIKAVGKPDEGGEADNNRIDYRWDTEGPINDPKHRVICKKLENIGGQLEKAGANYRTAFFNEGFGTVLGELNESDDVWTGPSACVSLKWQDANGTHSVTATDAEFVVDWDDAPESDVWNESDG